MSYFELGEFACKCKCGLNNTKPGLILKLNEARSIAGIPFKITSGSRCGSHNQAVGGSQSSSHLYGTAVDISCAKPSDRYKIVTALLEAGFTRIGVANSFIHVDIDDKKVQEVIWTYGG